MRRLVTILFAAIAIPAMASAQARPRHARTHHTRMSGGEVSMRSGMSRSQVQQLQQALRDDGCDPGPVDGVLGPHTRQAIACARQKHNLTGNNTNELLRTLNLPFTVNDSTGMGGVMRRHGNMRDTTGRMDDTTSGMMRHGMQDTMGRMHHGMRRGRGTARPDTTR